MFLRRSHTTPSHSRTLRTPGGAGDSTPSDCGPPVESRTVDDVRPGEPAYFRYPTSPLLPRDLGLVDETTETPVHTQWVRVVW